MPANRRRIKKNAGAVQRRQTRSLRIPLVPADQRRYFPRLRREGTESQISRREIKFLVISGIVGNVHLPVDSRDFAIGINDRRRIVIHPRRPPFK